MLCTTTSGGAIALPILDKGCLLTYSAGGFLWWGAMTGAESFPPILRRILARGGDDKLDYRSAWETDAA